MGLGDLVKKAFAGLGILGISLSLYCTNIKPIEKTEAISKLKKYLASENLPKLFKNQGDTANMTYSIFHEDIQTRDENDFFGETVGFEIYVQEKQTFNHAIYYVSQDTVKLIKEKKGF